MKPSKALSKGSFFYPAILLLIALLAGACSHLDGTEEGGTGGADAAIKKGAAPAATVSPAPNSRPASASEFSSQPLHTYGDYLISSGDLLDISVLGEEDLSLTVRVAENGVISFPLLGEVRATGSTHLELERKLEDLLNRDYLVSPSVSIAILEYSTISVLGQVKKPGAYEIKGRMTVTDAIALAGGLSEVASPNGTKVIRRGNGEKSTIKVRVKDILQDGDTEDNIFLKPGDIVFVPESFF